MLNEVNLEGILKSISKPKGNFRMFRVQTHLAHSNGGFLDLSVTCGAYAEVAEKLANEFKVGDKVRIKAQLRWMQPKGDKPGFLFPHILDVYALESRRELDEYRIPTQEFLPKRQWIHQAVGGAPRRESERTFKEPHNFTPTIHSKDLKKTTKDPLRAITKFPCDQFG